jgi:hypothetical protein
MIADLFADWTQRLLVTEEPPNRARLISKKWLEEDHDRKGGGDHPIILHVIASSLL